VRASYDALAAEYSARLFAELDGKPADRALLEELAARAAGPVLDLGCGPGHVTRYLAEHGADARGVDLSPAMVAEARRLSPELTFDAVDMRELPFDDDAFAAVVAFYSLIHFEDDEFVTACTEVARVLAPGGIFLASFHRGSRVEHFEELWGYAVDLDFRFFEPDEVSALLERTGFEVERVVEREPYEGVEVATRRFYVLSINYFFGTS
jgi:SAM-dependent methyltransferase